MVLAHLHRIDPDANMARFYCIDLAPTLFGEVTVLRRWGRIGTRGRMHIETWPSAAEAEAAANRTLRQKSHRGYRQPERLTGILSLTARSDNCGLLLSEQIAACMVLQWTTKGDADMGVHKQSVSFTDAAFNFARELVESGEYPNISAAVSGEMARARVAREREKALFEAEVQRRLALPLDAWERVRTEDTLTSVARSHLAKLAKAGGGHTS